MENRTRITKQVGAVKIEAVFNQNGIVDFYGDKGHARYDQNSGQWLKVHKEFGWRFKAQLKAAFLPEA